MAQTSNPRATKVQKVEVVRHKGQLAVPEDMTLQQVDQVIHEQIEYEEKVVQIGEKIPVFPWDGAHAFQIAMEEKFGWVRQVPTPGMFGPTPPALINVETGPRGETKAVAWGRFSLPGLEGWVATGVGSEEGRLVFVVQSQTKRKYEPLVRGLIERTKEILHTQSIYRGKAIRIRFTNDNGEALPVDQVTPKFLDLLDINEDDLVYSREVAAAIDASLFVPIDRKADTVREVGSWKRGVLLHGKYGTGKTLAALVAAKKAVAQGITFVYADNPQDFAEVVRFASMYSENGAIIFAEDIDRLVTGQRSFQVDQILNIIDGIESKGHELMIVLTSNRVDKVQEAALRPGRLDAVIHVEPPDAEAVEKLIRKVAGALIPADEDLTAVRGQLEGQIPAVVKEVVKRAKLAAIRNTKRGERVTHLTEFDLIVAAKSMADQIKLLSGQKDEPEQWGELLTKDVSVATAKLLLPKFKKILEEMAA